MSPKLEPSSRITGAPGDAAFQTTHWTVVLEAARPEDGDGGESFAKLYLDYWYPLYAYVRRRGQTSAEAEDLIQEFFASLLAKRSLAGLRREGGRFRSFLLTALNRFLVNGHERARAQKRGAGRCLLSIDCDDGE